MAYVWQKYTGETGFFGETTPEELTGKYGSPLYVYNEKILRERCREMKNLVSYPRFRPYYSVKANTNLSILKIVREEGLYADAMSIGEVMLERAAGFKPSEIVFCSNNVSREEMQEVLRQGILVVVDSLSQLRLLGELNRGGRVGVRLNTGIGTGHDAKVVTGGHETKFAIDDTKIREMKQVIAEYELHLVGVIQHIGSQFLDPAPYLAGVQALLPICKQFPELEFIDVGGGFGIPYKKQIGEGRLDLTKLGAMLDKMFAAFVRDYGREIEFRTEPGRYISAECGVLLGTVQAVKTVYENKFIGTDLGFNVLIRPVMYGSWHDVEVYREAPEDGAPEHWEEVFLSGNICESGDLITEKRLLPPIFEGNILGIMDAGAYGYSMSSNYNLRLRPAEVMIGLDGRDRLIRRRDTIEDLLRGFEG